LSPVHPALRLTTVYSDSQHSIKNVTTVTQNVNNQTTITFSQWRNYNFCPPPANIRYGLTVLIHKSGHFGPPLPFWAPGPRHCRGCRWLVTPLHFRDDILEYLNTGGAGMKITLCRFIYCLRDKMQKRATWRNKVHKRGNWAIIRCQNNN